ncbi:MAG: anthranilate phosphoribosyltransferase [Armatimonadetes bacterium]|nr:anthranilate phosphoribosyltransferase [Armatimonadota bacterium]
MSLRPLLAKLMQGADLTREEAKGLMQILAEGAFEPAQVGGLLVAMQVKGATAGELAGLAEALRERALALDHEFPNLVDTCGTGGGKTTFNLSTGAAIIAAAAGAKVAKHGNRSVTSSCGSADVLESLGVSFTSDPERLAHLLAQVGIVFLFAPHHHGSMKAVGPVRKALEVRTVFNQLGPLANPAGARRQLVGVYDAALIKPMAEALALLGAEHAFVVHSEDGMDEVSPCAPTRFAEVKSGRVTIGAFNPSDFGLRDVPESALRPCETIADSAAALREALAFEGARGFALVPSAAVALLLAGAAGTLEQAAGLATEAMRSGAATSTLRQFVEASQG